MTPERWQRVEELYHAAYDRPSGERAAFLAEACREDQVLRRQVESLLNESSHDGFLAAPTLGTAAELASSIRHTLPDMTGQSLGGYRLDALLGAGGMGEVYRSHDAKLGRDVAIKILPPAFTRHPDRLARFEREARMLAALNHPNICAIYGFEEADDVRFLVLELVEGTTLAHTLAHAANLHQKGGGLPLGQVLDVARQIAEALEVAHEKGIIHRDLKPANIKITPNGAVKILDFGLAKIVGGDGPSSDLSSAPTGDGVRRAGPVIGTAAYMSPEQARGLPVDKRTDIWAFGCVLYEMVTGRVVFRGDTISDSIAKILEREPDWSGLPAATPAPIRRLLLRCLTKDPKQRLRDIGDVRIEIDAIDEVLPGTPDVRGALAAPPNRVKWLPWVALIALAAGMIAREAWRGVPVEVAGNPLANATFSHVTNWAGTEEHAEISPDGRFVAFLADKAGELDVWVSQLGTGRYDNLTLDGSPMRTPGNLLRSLGFNGDGSEIWFSPTGNPAQHKILMPLTGGTSRPFLSRGRSTPSWSPDNARLAFIDAVAPGDPLYIADRIGANPVPINVPPEGKEPFVREGVHTHNPVWSPDGEWIYVVHGTGPTGRMDVWRMKPTGASPEQLTHQHADVNFLAPLTVRTLLYVARAEDWSGPWLWALDVESKVTRRVTMGLEHYTSVSASRDGSRVVATVATPTAGLWRVPLHNRRIEDRDVQPYPVANERALAPRFAGTSLFYLSLSTRGTGDGLWHGQNGQAFEVTKGADGVLSEPPAVSPDGSRVAVVVRQQGKRSLAVMSADGTNSRTLAASIEIQGVAGQSAADWSPDGTRIVAGGRDAQGPGLFMIPVDGGLPARLVAKDAFNPVWSPKGDWIVYATGFGGAGGRSLLRGVRPDGTDVQLPDVEVRVGGAHRFLPNGMGLVYLPSMETKDFWLLDFATNTTRQFTHFSDRGFLNTFDVTPDGQYLVFDRTRQNSDIVRIDLLAK
jgi:Tol biopolymer transport system component/tRNA A-37 threonylcarbamoyl transferase component Bud32